MTSFQVVFTPPSRKAKKENVKPLCPTPKLILGPFNATPEIDFGTVLMNDIISKSLILYNPSSTAITLRFGTAALATDRITCDDNEVYLNGQEEKHVHITWSPVYEGAFRKVIHIQDVVRSVRSFDVIVTGECINALKPKKKLKKKAKGSGYFSSQPVEKVKTKIRNEDKENIDYLNKTVVLSSKLTNSSNFSPSVSSQFHVSSRGNEQSSPFITSSPLSSSRENTIMNLDTSKSSWIDCMFSNLKYDEPNYKIHHPDIHFKVQDTLSAMDNICLSPALSIVSRRSTYALHTDAINDNLPHISSDVKLSNSSNFSDSLNSNGSRDSFNTASSKSIFGEQSNKPVFNSVLNASINSDVFMTPRDSFTSKHSQPIYFNEKNSLYDNTAIDTVDSAYSDLVHTLKGGVLVISPPNRSGWSSKKSSPRSSKKTSPRSRKVKNRVVSSPMTSYKRKSLNGNKVLRTPKNQHGMPVLKLSQRKKKTSPTVSTSIVRTPKYVPLANTSEDPFMKMIAYQDEEWLDKQERNIIKWMNSLLTPPVELDQGSWSVDAAEVWVKSSRYSNIKLAPSKEYFAATLYHSTQHLDTLRKAALMTFHSSSISGVLSKLSHAIENKTITIREDRDLHLDHGLRSKLMQLLCCYNTLWLRIGLETVYNQRIMVQSKGDIKNFIQKNLFTNDYINKKHSHSTVTNMRLPSFKDAMKKFILKKFLMLIYFLDQAKIKKLIRHDPCLFLKSSGYKSSKDLLLAFCSDLVVGHGDVIKHLKYMNYILIYKQTCLDEYDYSIPSLLALRDGVHITRILEILFGTYDLCSKLRVPAISILQKRHNVEVSLNALQGKCAIEGGITSQDIVLGYREKILSLLWQIINNYLGPRYNKAATKIQSWWRKIALRRFVWKHIEWKQKANVAAAMIQQWWKRSNLKREIRKRISQRIETRDRILMLKEREIMLSCAAIVIQRRYRANMAMRSERNSFLNLRNAMLVIQRRFRAYRLMVIQRHLYQELKHAAVFVQRKFHSNLEAKRCQLSFINLRNTAIVIQRWYRSLLLMKHNRQHFINLKTAALVIQSRFQAKKLAQNQRVFFLKLKNAALFIQRKFRAIRLMRKDRGLFLQLKNSAMIVQNKYRANKLAHEDRYFFLKLKDTTLFVQRKWRAIKIVERKKAAALSLLNAAVFIQGKYRAKKLMMEKQGDFLRLKTATSVLQRRYRAIKLMRTCKDAFIRQKHAVILIQQWYRGIKSMVKERNYFVCLRYSVIVIQRMYRSNISTRRCRLSFLQLRNAVFVIQNRYRAKKLMQRETISYLQLKYATLVCQERYRAKRTMLEYRNSFLRLKHACIIIQKWYRAYKLVHEQRALFIKLKLTVIMIQRKYRSKKLTEHYQHSFQRLRTSAIVIERRYRSNKLLRECRNSFLNLKGATITIQSRYRAKKLMVVERSKYLALKSASVVIQRRYRRNKSILIDRKYFLELKVAVIIIQRHYRANRLMRSNRQLYTELKQSAIVLQRWYRVHLAMVAYKQELIRKTKAVMIIQQKFKAYKLMKKQRNEFLLKKHAVTVIQKSFRKRKEILMLHGQLSMLKKYFAHIKYGDKLQNLRTLTSDQLRCIMNDVNRIDKAATNIQAVWKGYQVRKTRKLKKFVLQARPNEKYMTSGTLGERYQIALMQLKTSQMYSVILTALYNIDRVTGLSAKLCEDLTGEGVIGIIVGLLSRANRSVPSLDVCRAGISVLINLVRYNKTILFVWNVLKEQNEYGVLLIVHIMKYMHDKLNDSLFLYAATLMWILIQDPSIAQDIASIIIVKRQLEQIKENLWRKISRNPRLKKSCPVLPTRIPKWYGETSNLIFDDHFYAAQILYQQLYV